MKFLKWDKLNYYFWNSSIILFNSYYEFMNSPTKGTKQAVASPIPPPLPPASLSIYASTIAHWRKGISSFWCISLGPFSIGPHPGAFGHGSVPWHRSLGECTPCWMLSNGAEWSLMSLKMQRSVWCCSPGKITICAPEDWTQAFMYRHARIRALHAHTNTHTENKKHTFNWLFTASAHYCPFTE